MSDQEAPQSQSVHTHHGAHSHTRSDAKARFLIKFHRYRRLFFSKWWVLFLGAALGAGVGFAICYFGPPLFESYGQMVVGVKVSIPENSVYSEELSNFLGTQAALMQSEIVLSKALDTIRGRFPKLDPNQLAINVTVLPRTTIFQLRATGPDPDATQQFLQAAMEQYTDLKKRMRDQSSDTTVAGLSESLEDLQRDATNANNAILEFQTTNSIVFLEQQGNTAAQFLVTLKQKLAALQLEYGLLGNLTLDQNIERHQEAATEGLSDTNNPTGAPGMESLESEYLQAREAIVLLQAEKEELSHDLRPAHPKMIALSQQIDQWQRLMQVFRKNCQDQLDSRKQALSYQIDQTQKSINEQEGEALKVSRAATTFGQLQSRAQEIQQLYDRLMTAKQTLNMNKDITPETVNIMQPASPGRPARARMQKMLLSGGLIGLAAAVGLLLLVDRLDDRMGSYSELREIFDEEVLAQIPREKARNGDDGVALVHPDDERHAFVEAFRNLRSSLLFMADSAERPKLILLTSAIPNEGKSLTAANLAITLARAGSRVLLVDADLRKGALHRRFDTARDVGLSEVLTQGLKWLDAVVSTPVDNLFLLPRGGATVHSSELFLGPAMDAFLTEAESKFDFVLLDTVPVMAADDVTSLAPRVGAVVFVIRAEHTSARVARAALESLYQRQVDVLGLIFNAVPAFSVDYYYYYKYKDYYATYPSANSKSRGKKQKPAEPEPA
jgi:polysaccharide biosynthesis transport protein